MNWNVLEECKSKNSKVKARNIKAGSIKEYQHLYYMQVTKEKRKRRKHENNAKIKKTGAPEQTQRNEAVRPYCKCIYQS